MNWIDLLAKLDVYEHMDLAFHQVASGGNWVKLEWDRGACRGIDVERELKRRGVPICGRWFTSPSEKHPNGTLSCCVPKQQARWAEYVLTVYGIPFVSEPIDAKSMAAAQRRQDRPIPAWSEQRPQLVSRAITSQARQAETRSLLERLRDLIDDLL